MREECNDIVDMIYKTFGEEGAKEQVNIEGKTRKTIQELSLTLIIALRCATLRYATRLTSR
jgi:hypothetical protein